ncbi:DUF2141 domain-containing protein [Nostoc punctiforme]|uniref:DUF2141 domain-containing protein n=1 Tax=Nostoc punctiforme TaxID=272131 RepID=UPI0030ED23EB
MQWFPAHVLLLSVIGNLLIPSHTNTISNSLSKELTGSLQTQAFSNSNLLITIQGLKNQRGQVCLSLFANGRGFPSRETNAVQARCVKVTSTPLIVKFENLKPGSYAVAAFHDINGDGKLHLNALGIPTEEFGFSQNPQIVAGPPKFQDSAVFVVGSETDIQIQLQYF